MKNILTSMLLVVSIAGFSQSSNKYYFDGDMHPQPKSKAKIYGTGQMDSGLYQLTCYYMKRKHPLACVAYYADSTQRIDEGHYQFYYDNGIKAEEGNYIKGEKVGLWTRHNKEGKINDSTQYKNGRATKSIGFYYLTGSHQELVTVDDVANNEFYNTLYDAHGEVISQDKKSEDYTGVYFDNDTLCSFPGGPREWMRDISQAIMKHIDAFTDSDYGTVLLRFVVDTSGNISDVKPLNMKYSKLAMIAFNAIDAGPKWIPAEHDGKKVKAIRIQPVTLENPDR